MRSLHIKGFHIQKVTEPLLRLIEIFKELNIKGWRRNYKLIGKPDFVFPKQRVIVFADGCFWHGHDCRNTKPKDNAAYWQKKIQRNKERDFMVTETLIKKNWQVFRIWECDIKKKRLPKDFLEAFQGNK